MTSYSRRGSYLYDTETKLYYLKALYYDPETARFISRDPYGGDLGNPISQNFYAYANGDPINFADPSGSFAETALDVGSLGLSMYDFYNDPSWGNGGYLAWDVAATFLPFIPGSWAGKVGKSLSNVGNYLAKKVPNQVTPGIRQLTGQYVDDLGRVQPNATVFSLLYSL
nr:RHS repeat-associated core domain-containing protein [Desulfosporosinus hippei]